MDYNSRKVLRNLIEPVVEKLLRILFFWTTTEKEFGDMLILLHIVLFWIFVVTVALVFVIRAPPLFIMGMIILAILLLAQHYLLGACILSSIEKRVNGRPYPMAEPILTLFGIPTTTENIRGFTCLTLTIIVLCFSLQLVRVWINGR